MLRDNRLPAYRLPWWCAALVVCAALSGLAPAPAAAVTWSEPVRISNDEGFSGYPAIVVYAQTIIVVWHDDRFVENEIFMNRSLDGGRTWEGERRLTTSASDSSFPKIAVTRNGELHLVFQDNRANVRGQQFDVYYMRSTDFGQTWSAERPLLVNAGRSLRPTVAALNDLVHVAWHDISGGVFDLMYIKSQDAGLTWSTPTQLTAKEPSTEPDTNMPNHPPSLLPRFDLFEDRVGLVWYDCRHDREPLRRPYSDNWEVYFQESRNSGETWRSPVRITDKNGMSTHPDVVWLNRTDYLVAWVEEAGTDRGDIFVKGRLEPATPLAVGAAPRASASPSLVKRGSNLGLIWHDNRDLENVTWQLYFAESSDGGLTWSSAEKLTDATRFAGFAEMDSDGNNYFVVYQDDRHSPANDIRVNNFEIYFQRGNE